uniref:SCP domain-containing protein n=1 Tax=Glossina brevipalpis TaxID=37001 RepID=A0A1A9WJY1_9MUSC
MCENIRKLLHHRCPSDAMVMDINEFKSIFVHEHNKRRNRIASGKLSGYYPATRMATMVWDDELQYLAGSNVRTCILDHYECNHTYRFKNSGQNLCSISRLKSVRTNITDLISETLHLWFDTEYQLIDHTENYGHFAELILDRNTHVGCEILRFTPSHHPISFVYHIVYNYASVYALDAPLYEVGYPDVKCKTGRNSNYSALCSIKEFFDPNY